MWLDSSVDPGGWWQMASPCNWGLVMYVAIFSRGRKLISCARLNALVHEFKDCMRTIDGITTHKGIPGMHTSPRKSNARLHRNTSDMGSELQRIASQCIIMGVFCIMVCIYVICVYIYIYTSDQRLYCSCLFPPMLEEPRASHSVHWTICWQTLLFKNTKDIWTRFNAAKARLLTLLCTLLAWVQPSKLTWRMRQICSKGANKCAESKLLRGAPGSSCKSVLNSEPCKDHFSLTVWQFDSLTLGAGYCLSSQVARSFLANGVSQAPRMFCKKATINTPPSNTKLQRTVQIWI